MKKYLICFFALIQSVMFFSLYVYAANEAQADFKVIKIFHTGGELPSNKITALDASGDWVAVGTDKGLGIYNKKEKKWKVRTDKDLFGGEKTIKKLVIRNGELWILAQESLFVYNFANDSFGKPKKSMGLGNPNVNDFAMSRNICAVAAKSGLLIYNFDNNKLKTFGKANGLADDNIMSVTIRGDFIFVSCVGTAVSKLNPDGESFITYKPDDSSFTNVFLAFNGPSLWCGTNGKGVRQFNLGTESWTVYTMADGMSDEFVQAMEVDGSKLWIGLFNGLNKYDIESKQWKNYALPENSVTALAVDGNYIWIGTDNGLVLANK